MKAFIVRVLLILLGQFSLFSFGSFQVWFGGVHMKLIPPCLCELIIGQIHLSRSFMNGLTMMILVTISNMQF